MLLSNSFLKNEYSSPEKLSGLSFVILSDITIIWALDNISSKKLTCLKSIAIAFTFLSEFLI